MNHKLFFFACALNLFYYVPNLLASPVIGGQEDTDNVFKYHVNIYNNYNPAENSAELLCGGAIIDDNYVLTAAHCFKKDGHVEITRQPKSSKIIVIAGTVETYGSGIAVGVDTVFIPRVYTYAPNRYADIAVLKLVASLNVAHRTDRLQIFPLDPGHLPSVYENKNAIIAGNGCDTLYIADDGVLRPRLEHYPKKRKYLHVHMLERASCPFFDHSICTINIDRENIRTCAKGDSGSPIIYDNTIIGVLSRGPNRYTLSTQGMIFTRVTTFIHFIRNAMDERDEHREMYILDH